MISARRSALLWITGVLGVVGLVAFVLAYEMGRREAADFLDGQLRQIAINVGDKRGEAKVTGTRRDPEDEFVITIWNAAGERIYNSPPEIGIPRLLRPGLATIHAAGDDWRVYRFDDGHRTVQVAQRMTVLLEMAGTAALQAGLPVLVAIPLAWLAIGWALGRVFHTLLGIERTIASRGAESDEPIPADGVPLEVQPLVQAMNDLLVRIRRAVARQRRFVSDAAHELRTPLAALQIQIDNLTAAGIPAAEQPLADMRAGIARAAHMVGQLLGIARLDEDRRPPMAPVDLAAVVTQCVADFIPIAEARDIDLGLAASGVPPIVITGVAAELATLFGNLVENAIRYTPAGGTVDVRLDRTAEGVMVEIADSGRGIPEADLPHVFDRFFRAAPDGSEGSGLGLSIVDAIARHHGFKVRLANRDDGPGLRARVLIGQPSSRPDSIKIAP